MARLFLIGVVAAVVFTVFSIIDCAVQPSTRHRGVSKAVWVLITLVPVIGGVLWFVLGRSRGPSSSFTVPDAPDDDPSFLRDARVSEADERIRQLEDELRRLDEESAADDRGDEGRDGDHGGPDRRGKRKGDGSNGRPDARA